jgi:alpha-D-ribose 1-methylphosphonate 5-phosphate C-P lyase
MSPSPIPRWDIRRLNNAENLTLLGAGREKRVYAVPPHTRVEPLEFEDVPFAVERFDGRRCGRCGSSQSYLDEVYDEKTGKPSWACSDTGYCASLRDAAAARTAEPRGGDPGTGAAS